MDKTSSSECRPAEVPFVGWSRAAHEFRGQVAQLAPGGAVRPLIIGDQGVGKKTMARAWQVVAGKAADNRIEDLDWGSIGLPTCFIGVTTFRPPPGRSSVLLGSDSRGEVPRAADPSAANGPELEDEIAHLFDLSLYMPPLADGRQIDVLAFLDYWNRARSPFVGIRYAKVSLRWLRRLVIEGPWAANLDGIYRQLRMLNHLNRPTVADSDDLPIIHEVDALRERPKHPSSGGGPSEEAGEDAKQDEGEIAFEAIPDLAVRTYLWCCQNASFDERGSGAAGAEPDSPRVARWPARDFAPDLTAGEFRRLTEEQFARQHVLPGLTGSLATRPDRLAIVMEWIRRRTTFGTTFRALQEGLTIDPVDVERRLGRPGGDSRTKWGAEKAGGPAAPAATEAAGLPGWAGNSFCIEDETYLIVFREPGGRIEQARLPVAGNLGLFYYRRLIQNPETAFSARRLSAEGRDQERPAGDALQDAHELGAEHKPIVHEAIDQEGLRNIEAKLVEIEGSRFKAERDGDLLELQELDEERQAIINELEKYYHKRRVKNLDGEAKKLQDSIRRALEAARTKLIKKKMSGLSDYLAQQVSYKQGSWTYRPSRTAPHWVT